MNYVPPVRRLDSEYHNLGDVAPAPTISYDSLDPAVRIIWMINRFIFWLMFGFLGIVVFGSMLFAMVQHRGLILLGGAGIGVLAIVHLFWPLLSYYYWGFAIRESDVLIRSGVLFKHVTAIPFARIQHVDTDAGPIERSFGITNLIIHTAGSHIGSMAIPGLPEEHAEALRDYLSEVGHTHANL